MTVTETDENPDAVEDVDELEPDDDQGEDEGDTPPQERPDDA